MRLVTRRKFIIKKAAYIVLAIGLLVIVEFELSLRYFFVEVGLVLFICFQISRILMETVFKNNEK